MCTLAARRWSVRSTAKGEGVKKNQPHAKQIAHAPQPSMWGSDAEGQPVPVASDAERPLSVARRKVTRRSKG